MSAKSTHEIKKVGEQGFQTNCQKENYAQL